MSKNISKRMKTANQLKQMSTMSIQEAIKVLKTMPQPKFDAGVDVVIKLNINAAKSDQAVRGAASMPSGLGKTVKIVVFAAGDHPYADYLVQSEDQAKEFLKNPIDINAAVATPDIMTNLMKWGISKILGPKGLMPNAKTGTVTFDVEKCVKALRQGQAKFKNDKAGYLHVNIGKLSFTDEALVANFNSLMEGVIASKPAAAKLHFIDRVHINATMCPSVKVVV